MNLSNINNLPLILNVCLHKDLNVHLNVLPNNFAESRIFLWASQSVWAPDSDRVGVSISITISIDMTNSDLKLRMLFLPTILALPN